MGFVSMHAMSLSYAATCFACCTCVQLEGVRA